jgi:hypothetical protein
MTTIYLFQENIRRFVEELTDGQGQLISAPEDQTAPAQKTEPGWSCGSHLAFPRYRRDSRKGVEMWSSVLSGRPDHQEQWR